jgi:antitoxin ParD1/3/4
MNVSLTPELEALVHRKVKTGLYSTASEVVREALRQMDERDRLARLREVVAIGIAEADQGKVVELTPALWDEIEREADEDERRGVPIDPDVCP